eukprot:364643-Chlamydomonas_euryale.AAC.7
MLWIGLDSGFAGSKLGTLPGQGVDTVWRGGVRSIAPDQSLGLYTSSHYTKAWDESLALYMSLR